jgi:hypothetical protein
VSKGGIGAPGKDYLGFVAEDVCKLGKGFAGIMASTLDAKPHLTAWPAGGILTPVSTDGDLGAAKHGDSLPRQCMMKASAGSGS